MNKLQNNFFGMNMVFFFGVIEDRNDPLKMGRVRVRCFSWHTNDKTKLPTDALPWAQCMQPVTSAALSGIGRSATGLVEGSWVVGFFLDGETAQKPMVMGSIAGIPTELPDKSLGFNNTTNTYPDLINEPDLPRPARGELEANLNVNDGILPTKLSQRPARDTHYETKIAGRAALGAVPTAVAPSVTGFPDKGSADYVTDEGEVPYWYEPNPRYGGESDGVYESGGVSVYPMNHVNVSESGHVHEIDDTPNAERLHEFHKSGSFVETQQDGTKITKVVGKDYHVVIEDGNVFIKGNMSVTVSGNAKMYVQGDQYIEVEGDQYVTVRGDRVTKIQGSDIKEVVSDKSTNINGNKFERVGGNRDEQIQQNHTEKVQGNYSSTINANNTSIISGNQAEQITGTLTSASGGNMSIGTASKLDVGATDTAVIKSTNSMRISSSASTMSINSNTAMNIESSHDDITIKSSDSGKIDLNPA